MTLAVRVREDRVGVRVEPVEHLRDRRDELDRVGLEAGDDAPPGTPSPSRTRRWRRCVESGRSISGRIGISFASTVSSVIAVPVTQSCLPLVDAGLDRRDLVLGGLVERARPAAWIRATDGSTNRVVAGDRRLTSDPTARTAAISGRRDPGDRDGVRRRGDEDRGEAEVDQGEDARPTPASRSPGSGRTGRRTCRRSPRACSTARSRPA